MNPELWAALLGAGQWGGTPYQVFRARHADARKGGAQDDGSLDADPARVQLQGITVLVQEGMHETRNS